MKTTQDTLNKIAEFEGIRLKAYKPVAAERYWTIGIGHYGADVTEGMTITRERAFELFRQDIQKYEQAVEKNVSLKLSQPQFDALVSFTYNCGAGNLRKLVLGRDYQQIADAILLYNKGSGKVLPGLTRRRKWEHDLFLSGSTEKKNGNPYAVPTKIIKKGSKGNSVRWLQYELSRHGYHVIIDGVFGIKTEACVCDFQRVNDLTVDGIVGDRTRAELINGK